MLGNDGQAGTVLTQEPVRGEERGLVLRLPEGTADRIARKGAGRRYRTAEKTNRGKYEGITLRRSEDLGDLALDATVRAAAPFQKNRENRGCAITLCEEDFRFKRRKSRAGATVLFAVDASGSMGAARRMKDTKEAVLSMLMDSYQKRDKVGCIAFRGQRARVLLNFTSSVDLAQKALQTLPVGGRTPLADALYRAWQLFRAQKRRDPGMRPLLVLVTDARANSPLWSDDPVKDALDAARLIAGDNIPSIVVDTENDFISFGLGEKIAKALGGSYFKAGELKREQLYGRNF